MLDWALYTDLYQLTMAQGFYERGHQAQEATFSLYFRDYPFKGGYAIACGMAEIAHMLSEYHFSEDDIAYLASLEAPDGGLLFHQDFLSYLRTFTLSVSIDAVLEGTVVFPHEPILRVQGPLLQCQMLETLLLNCISFETLIATKAARVCFAASGRPVTEFGLRRAQGLGGLWASRAAFVGGCASTSNVLAGKLFDIPVSGTHSHSWVMSFASELDSFRAYAEVAPGNCSLLVDTYDVEQGVQNAITVAKEMAEQGKRVRAVRIDSGDLTWLSKRTRAMLDDAGLPDVAIMLTNDLDEYLIQSIIDEGACVDIFGVGTKLATAFNQPTLGGVYKLTAIRDSSADVWRDCLKVSESSSKLTTPGVLDVRRYYHTDGTIAGDMVFDTLHLPENEEQALIVDPHDALRQKRLGGKPFKTLLQPFYKEGALVVTQDELSAAAAQKRAAEQLATLDETQLRLFNPHTYPVGLEEGLHERRQRLVSELRAGA